VQFEFVRDSGEIVPLSDEKLCAEYILDMTELGATAGYWIVKNCVNIKDEDGKHLYFKFREEGDPPPDEMIIPESQPEAPSWLQIGTYTAIFSLLMVAKLCSFSTITCFDFGVGDMGLCKNYYPQT
jgi:hypothetical protein